MRRLVRVLFLTGMLAAWAGVDWDPAQAAEFSAPVPITDGSLKYRLSRTADRIMAVDRDGTLHLAYWAGSEFGTTASLPSFVYYRTWNPLAGWSDPVQVDQSESGDGTRLGGRHPSLALTPEEEVWMVWNDSRHATQAGNWIDNIEIYADRKPKEGEFVEGDIRLTDTGTVHLGDNGYTPKIVADETGTLSLAWYDYHFDKDVSDLFLMTGEAQTGFATGALEGFRLTDSGQRGGSPAFSVPDLAVDSEGTRHLVWVGGLGAGGDLYYGAVDAAGVFSGPQLLASGGADFFDPPHIAVGPEGEVWVVYGDDSVAGAEDLALLRKPPASATFEGPIRIDPQPDRQMAPDLKVDRRGTLHLVWLDLRSGPHLRYATFNPTTALLSEVQTLTPTTANWNRPCLEIDRHGFLYVVWEENLSVTRGNVWFTTTAGESPLEVRNWAAYE